MRCSYDQRWRPPAPVVPVTLRRPWARQPKPCPVTALLDTGADITIVPSGVPPALGALPFREVYIRPIEGARIGPLPTYLVELELDGHCEVVEVAALGDEVIAGRNWLNSFHITLDCPRLVLTMREGFWRALRRMLGRALGF